MEKNNLSEHINKTVKQLEKYLHELSEDHIKKAELISYWLRKYIYYLKQEETFIPSRNPEYKKGDIVRVNLGFNIGSEHGGRHYAIILDNNNNKNNPVVTIIPLSSYKGKTIRNSEVFLGDNIYNSLNIKISGIQKAYIEDQKNKEKLINSTISIVESINVDTTEDYIEKKKQIEANIEQLKLSKERIIQKQKEINAIATEIKKMKHGSIALVGQITTISKIRIEDPVNTHGVLTNIRISSSEIEQIENKIKELYLGLETN